ncbi:hypothetical protein BDN72DRAFT_896615 [Pluteus cervinus]|uniref:Uncharacterized protein n=1 Tax=Pluteus cervinus TaxID=181527 RepID=A0ACD3AY96_9AGAR|nr:hypothetical protein BDN72DRAFT_896615 [Pluteus cervinus]
MFRHSLIWSLQLLLTLRHWLVAGYVPASPSNVTESIAAGANGSLSNTSLFLLEWYPSGSYFQNVTHVLAGEGSDGISKGACVEFSEADVNSDTPPTSTPWIALVSCDANATNASPEVDIFTLAKNKGATAAVLYSPFSQTCLINPEFAEAFDPPFDIFSIQSRSSSLIIQNQFDQGQSSNQSLYSTYNSQQLNESSGDVQAAIRSGVPTTPGFMLGILQVANTSFTLDGTSGGNAKPTATNGSPDPIIAQSLLVLYAIMGCASASLIL